MGKKSRKKRINASTPPPASPLPSEPNKILTRSSDNSLENASHSDLLKRISELEQQLETRPRASSEEKLVEISPDMFTVENNTLQTQSLGRCASWATKNALNQLPKTRSNKICEKMLAKFADDEDISTFAYFETDEFANDLIRLSGQARNKFCKEQRNLELASPIYVFGDIHGNYNDLKFFKDHIWRLGMHLSAGNFLFLGDYVDRGMLGLEVVAYLFALKMKVPDKMFLLRGNHELRYVNGNTEFYEDGSFYSQCTERFGNDKGEKVWEAVNHAFDCLPLTAVIDGSVFCVHGGIPRPFGSSNRLEKIQQIPCPATVDPPTPQETEEIQGLVSDLLWSDPAEEDEDLDAEGFAPSERGGDCVKYGQRALDDFLDSHNLKFVIRAHQAAKQGVQLSKGAKVFTVFSTSKDHNIGRNATCGCLLVDRSKIVAINRSKNHTMDGVIEEGDEEEEEEDDDDDE